MSQNQNLPEPEKAGKDSENKDQGLGWPLWTFLFVCIFFIGSAFSIIVFSKFFLDPKVEQLKNQVSILKSDYEVFENQVVDLKKEKKKLEAKITLLDSANRVLLLKTDSLANASEYSGVQIPVTPLEVLVGVSDERKLLAAFVLFQMTPQTKIICLPDSSVFTDRDDKTIVTNKLLNIESVLFDNGGEIMKIELSNIMEIIAAHRE